MSHSLKVFFDEETFTLTYILFDKQTKDAIVIDPVLDYDIAASKIFEESLDKVHQFAAQENLKIHYILETHAHADHLSGAVMLKKRVPGAKIAIGKHIVKVQEIFKEVFNLQELASNGAQFDHLLDEDRPLKAGSIEVKTIFTPGHTPACASYLVQEMLFTGDTLFMPDYGTGRCDFPGGSAADLYHSIKEKLYVLPDETRIFTGHDYLPNGRELQHESTIGDSKRANVHLQASTKEEEFVQYRTARDQGLRPPRLLFPSIQVNINAGELPRAESNGVVYLKVPIHK